MIWSVAPCELFAAESRQALLTVQYRGCSLLVETEGLPSGKGRIVRLLSSDPQHFLQEQFAPGSIIDIMQ